MPPVGASVQQQLLPTTSVMSHMTNQLQPTNSVMSHMTGVAPTMMNSGQMMPAMQGGGVNPQAFQGLQAELQAAQAEITRLMQELKGSQDALEAEQAKTKEVETKVGALEEERKAMQDVNDELSVPPNILFFTLPPRCALSRPLAGITLPFKRTVS